MRIKKGDKVLIIAGKDRGKSGKVLQSFPKEGRIIAENINLLKKYRRSKKQGEKGQIVEIAGTINVSNVMLICPKCNQPSRTGKKRTERGSWRYCKKCSQEFN